MNPGNASSVVPVAMMGTDGAMWPSPLPVVDTPYGCNATTISANATSTIKSGGGHFYGLSALALGTLWTAAVYDINGTSTKVLTAQFTLAALGIVGLAAPPSIGVRFDGNLVVVTAGTLAGSLNALWD